MYITIHIHIQPKVKVLEMGLPKVYLYTSAFSVYQSCGSSPPLDQQTTRHLSRKMFSLMKKLWLPSTLLNFCVVCLVCLSSAHSCFFFFLPTIYLHICLRVCPAKRRPELILSFGVNCFRLHHKTSIERALMDSRTGLWIAQQRSTLIRRVIRRFPCFLVLFAVAPPINWRWTSVAWQLPNSIHTPLSAFVRRANALNHF